MKLNKIGEVWNSANRLLSDFIGLLSSKILLPWQRDVTTSPLYSKTKQISKIAGSYDHVIWRRDAHPVREIKGVCHTLGVGVVFPQRGRGKGPLFWVIALSEICPVRWCSKGVLWWIFIWKRSERNAFKNKSLVLFKVACKSLPQTMIFFPLMVIRIKPGTSALVIKTNNRRTFYEITKKLGEKALSKIIKKSEFYR